MANEMKLPTSKQCKTYATRAAAKRIFEKAYTGQCNYLIVPTDDGRYQIIVVWVGDYLPLQFAGNGHFVTGSM